MKKLLSIIATLMLSAAVQAQQPKALLDTRNLSDLANASTARTNMGVAIGTNVQAFDADLTTWAGVTPGTGISAALGVAIGSAGAPVLFNGAGGTPSSITLTNASGTAASLTAGNVTTNASLTGHITSTGNAAILGSFTFTQLNTALTGDDAAGIGTANSWADGIKQTFNPDGTNAGLNAGSQAGDPSSLANGDLWYDSTNNTLDARINGATVNLGGGGAGTVTVVSAGSLTSTALVTGGGTTTLQTPSATATMDSSGNISTPGTITSGAGSGASGAFTSLEGTAPSLTANAFKIYSATDVAAGGLAYLLPDAASSGVLQATNAAGVMTLSHSALTSGRVTFATTNGLLLDDSDMTFDTATLTTTNQVVGTSFDLGTAGVRMTNDADGAMTLLGRGDGTDEDLTLNFDDTANTVVVSSSTGVTTINTGAIGLVSTGPSSIGPLVDAVDGSTPLNNLLSAYGAGSAYSLTNAAAAIDFGTTDPSITLSNAGTYTIYAQIHVAYAAATVAAETATFTVRRTNNTAADLGQSVVIDLPISTALTHSYGTVTLPPFSVTTANTNDALTINANVSATLGAGTINATAVGTSIIAIRRY